MGKIERRRRVVELHQGNYEADLAALLDQMWAAKREEEAETPVEEVAPRRVGQKPEPKTKPRSIELAEQYDRLLTEAEETAEKVTVWAIGHDEWSQLADLHPPRDDVPEDKETGQAARTFADDQARGVNVKTFPPALLKVALVDPDTAGVAYLDDKLALGGVKLAELNLSRIHYVKLETAAWNVNVGDDALPKFSLVSLLNQESSDGSKPPNDSE